MLDEPTIASATEARKRLRQHLRTGAGPALGLESYVLAAYGEFLDDAERPEWQSGVFTVLRVLQASPELQRLDAKRALAAAERVLAGWVTGDGPVALRAAAAWEEFFGITAEDARVEFLDGWGKVRCVLGHGPLERAWATAQARPVEFGPEQLSVDTPGYRLFLGFAGWLQVATGPAPIWLPVRRVGGLLGVQGMTVSRYRSAGIRDGFLREVERASFPSLRATRLVFSVDRVPVLKQAARPDVLAWVGQRFA